MVLGPVEGRRAQPILQREFVTVPDAQAALLGTVDEEQAAERPERLPAEIGTVLLVEDQHSQAALDQFAGGYQARKTSSDNDDISVEPRRLG
jgi:hypothetical protein